MQSSRPPSFAVVAPDGRRVTVEPASFDDTVADLAAALRVPASGPFGLWIDGRFEPGDRLLVETEILAGSVTSTGCPPPDRGEGAHVRHGAVGLRAEVVAGPDCRPGIALSAGRHLVGRVPAAGLRLDDPTVELHHGVVDVAADGAWSFTQLTGSTPVTASGRVAVGASAIVFRTAEPPVPVASSGRVVRSSGDPWRRVVVRAPVLDDLGPETADDTTIHAPEPVADPPRPAATPLVGAAVGVIGAVAMGMVLGRLWFALFSLLGAVASAAIWSVSTIGWWRCRKRLRRESAAADAAFTARLEVARDRARRDHLRRCRDLDHLWSVVGSGDVWWWRIDGSDEFTATVGTARHRWTPPVGRAAGRPLTSQHHLAVEQATDLGELPTPVQLRSGEVVAFSGLHAAAVARSVVAQLAVHSGPADWRLVVVSARPERWAWASWLPHVLDRAGRPAIVDSGGSDAVGSVEQRLAELRGDDRPVLLVVDDPTAFELRTGAVRRFVEAQRPRTLAVVGPDSVAPALSSRVLAIGATGRATWHGAHLDIGAVGEVTVAGITERTAAWVARSLHGLVDPEDVATSSGPTDVALSDLDPVASMPPATAVAEVVRRWRSAGRDPAPATPVGTSSDGVVEIDLRRDGPHALVAGTTGSGKSEFLRTLVVGMAARVAPDHLTFVLVDYKGGATFDACADLPHVVGQVTDLDEGLAERALVSLDAELHRREAILRAVGAADLTEYRCRDGVAPLPRLVIVIDEFAAMARELPDFLSALVGIAQRGRSLGVHLVLATQRPAGVVGDDIRANTDLRLALRLNDPADVRDVLGELPSAGSDPSRFPRAVPGRAALRLGPGELVTFQTACCTGAPPSGATGLRVRSSPGTMASRSPGTVASRPTGTASSPVSEGGAPSELRIVVDAVRRAAAHLRVSPPHRPWLPPLPAVVSVAEVEAIAGRAGHDAVGLIDDPAGQCRRPLRWDHAVGNLELAGPIGSGTSSTLLAVLSARCRRTGPDALHGYVIDARGDGVLDAFARLPHCGAVLRTAERERVERLLRRLTSTIDDRLGSGETRPAVVLAVDGLPALLGSLDSVDDAPTLAMFDRLVADGPSVGISACWSTDDAHRRRAPAAHRWVFDGPVPGRVRPSPGSVAQVVSEVEWPRARLGAGRERGGPAEVRVLPELVRSDDVLTGAGAATEGVAAIAVGLASADLSAAILHLPALDHVFVGGAARTGKSTALRQLAAGWRAVHPDGEVVQVDRRRPLTADRLVGGPVLVVVDDADRVDDDGGLLGELVTSGCPGVTVFAAARADAVRASYGHWVRTVVRSRCGLLLTAHGDPDGDLFGVTLPRRTSPGPRPGLAWLIDGFGHRLVQVACRPEEWVPAVVGTGGAMPVQSMS